MSSSIGLSYAIVVDLGVRRSVSLVSPPVRGGLRFLCSPLAQERCLSSGLGSPVLARALVGCTLSLFRLTGYSLAWEAPYFSVHRCCLKSALML
ncbi:hypothetical protein YC2023_018961 [Brassica napus]